MNDKNPSGDDSLLSVLSRDAAVPEGLSAEEYDQLNKLPPQERCLKGLALGSQISAAYASQIILDALRSQPDTCMRTALALAIYGTTHRRRNLQTSVIDALAREIHVFLPPGPLYTVPLGFIPGQMMANFSSSVKALTAKPATLRDKYGANLLRGLLMEFVRTCHWSNSPDWMRLPEKTLAFFRATWDQLEGVTANHQNLPPKGA